MCDDQYFMRLAIQEAKKGLGRTSPNPLVGAILVNNDCIVGTGFHKKAGTPHAEVNAITAAAEKTVGSTLYVTLEPCNHLGRTPPCSQAVVEAGITKVVIGMNDPNPDVIGGGGDYLLSRGVEVRTGVLEEECRRLNYPFIKHSTTGLPWVVMKAGLSLDGRISYEKKRGGEITGPASRRDVHLLRDQLDGILIGIGTALIDNPSLTTRIPGSAGEDPRRIVLDAELRLPLNAKMLKLDSTADTIVFCEYDASAAKAALLEERGARIFRVRKDEKDQLDLGEVLEVLGSQNITSLLVEGGSRVHGSFVKQQRVDQVYLYLAPIFIGEHGAPLLSGYRASDKNNAIKLRDMNVQQCGEDILVSGLMSYSS